MVVLPGTATRKGNDVNPCIVATDSPIRTANDLEGKRLASVALNNIIRLYAREWPEKIGADVSRVRIIQVPFVQMQDALLTGRADAVHSVRGVDRSLLETASTFRVPRARLVTRVTFPAALPMVAAGLRIALASALITTVVIEMIAGGGGIGQYVVTMQNAARMPEVCAAPIMLSLVGYALNRSLLALEHRALPWYRRSA